MTLLRHWLQARRLLAEELSYLEHALMVRYE
jgi:hypothetical protein